MAGHPAERAIATRTAYRLQEESAWGVVASGQQPKGIRISRETMQEQLRTSGPRFRLGGTRVGTDGIKGSRRAGGELVGSFQPLGAWPLLIKHALGIVSTAGSGPTWTHSMKGGETLPVGLTLERVVGETGGTFSYYRYTGCRVQALGIKIPSDGEVEGRVSLLCKEEVHPVSGLTPTPIYQEPNLPFHKVNASLQIDTDGNGSLDTVGTITTFDLNISNNLKEDHAGPASGELRTSIPATGRRNVSGAMTLFVAAESKALHALHRAQTPSKILISLASGGHTMLISIPRVQFSGPSGPTIQGKVATAVELKYQAYTDGANELVMSLSNTEDAIDSAL